MLKVNTFKFKSVSLIPGDDRYDSAFPSRTKTIEMLDQKDCYLHGWGTDSDGDQTFTVGIVENPITGRISLIYAGLIQIVRENVHASIDERADLTSSH